MCTEITLHVQKSVLFWLNNCSIPIVSQPTAIGVKVQTMSKIYIYMFVLLYKVLKLFKNILLIE